MALYLLYGIVSITRRFKLTELLVYFVVNKSCLRWNPACSHVLLFRTVDSDLQIDNVLLRSCV